jgi:hypothetical protein
VVRGYEHLRAAASDETREAKNLLDPLSGIHASLSVVSAWMSTEQSKPAALSLIPGSPRLVTVSDRYSCGRPAPVGYQESPRPAASVPHWELSSS